MPELTLPAQPFHSLPPVLFAAALSVPSAPAMRARGPDSQTSDDELLELFAAGQRPAADELLRRHQAAAFAVAYRFLHNHVDAQDAVQEGFAKAWKCRNLFKGGSFAAWLQSIIRNAALEIRRRRRCSQAAEAEYAANHPRYERSSVLVHLLAQERWTWADRVLLKHADDTMLAIVHWRRKGLTYAQIARVLGCCRQTVAKSMKKAMSILRTDLLATG
jgi:RNA polymerase sigma-70 factor (ECF subfamily)